MYSALVVADAADDALKLSPLHYRNIQSISDSSTCSQFYILQNRSKWLLLLLLSWLYWLTVTASGLLALGRLCEIPIDP